MVGIRDQSSIGTVNQQVSLFEDCLPNQDFIAQHQAFLDSITSQHFDSNRIRDRHGLLTAVGVLRNALPCKPNVQQLRNMQGNHCSYGACINDGVRLVSSYLVCRQLAPTRESRIDTIRKFRPDAHFAQRVVSPILPHSGRTLWNRLH